MAHQRVSNRDLWAFSENRKICNLQNFNLCNIILQRLGKTYILTNPFDGPKLLLQTVTNCPTWNTYLPLSDTCNKISSPQIQVGLTERKVGKTFPQEDLRRRIMWVGSIVNIIFTGKVLLIIKHAPSIYAWTKWIYSCIVVYSWYRDSQKHKFEALICEIVSCFVPWHYYTILQPTTPSSIWQLAKLYGKLVYLARRRHNVCVGTGPKQGISSHPVRPWSYCSGCVCELVPR